MLRSILIDDEPQNAIILKKDLEMHCPAVDVIAVCHSAKEGIMTIKKEKPEYSRCTCLLGVGRAFGRSI